MNTQEIVRLIMRAENASNIVDLREIMLALLGMLLTEAQKRSVIYT
jgi:hypothetical protein